MDDDLETGSSVGGRKQRRGLLLWSVLGVVGLAVIVALVWSVQGSGSQGSPGATVSGSVESRVTPSATEPLNTAPVQPEMSPVEPREQVTTATKLVVKLTKTEAVQGEAKMPGDVGGPAVRVTVSITNSGTDPVSLANTVVNGYYGADRIPADSLVSPGGSPFEGSVEPGATAEGVYIFVIPTDQRSEVTVTVDTKAGTAAAVFHGRMG